MYLGILKSNNATQKLGGYMPTTLKYPTILKVECTYFNELNGQLEDIGKGLTVLGSQKRSDYEDYYTNPITTTKYVGLEIPCEKVDLNTASETIGVPLFIEGINWQEHESVFCQKEFDFKSIKDAWSLDDSSPTDGSLLKEFHGKALADFFFNKKQGQKYFVHIARAVCTNEYNYVMDYFNGLRDKKTRKTLRIDLPVFDLCTLPSDKANQVNWGQSRAISIRYSLIDSSNIGEIESSTQLEDLPIKTLGTIVLLNLKDDTSGNIELSEGDFKERTAEWIELSSLSKRFTDSWLVRRQITFYTSLENVIKSENTKADLNAVGKDRIVTLNQYASSLKSIPLLVDGKLSLDDFDFADNLEAMTNEKKLAMLANLPHTQQVIDAKLSTSADCSIPEIKKFVDQCIEMVKAQGYTPSDLLGSSEICVEAPMFWFAPDEFCYQEFCQKEDKNLGIVIQDNASIELPDIDPELIEKIDWSKSKAITVEYTVCHPTEQIMDILTNKLGTVKYCRVNWTKLHADEKVLEFNTDYAHDDFTPKVVIAFLQFKA